VLVDANQLEMTVLNLTVNARDAMPAGGQIVIATREESIAAGDASGLKPGCYICLAVRDTGTGMDEETMRRATEPFFTTKGVGKGTGLGLSMVHGVAEQSGGRLTLQSRMGEGTTAEIWLPVADTHCARARFGQIQRSAASHAVVNHGSLVVLAVDDDGLVLTNTIAMLDDLGHTGLPASSGQEALDILRRGDLVDVVITDQVMPRMTGQQLAEAIQEELPGLPVILATGYSDMEPGVEARWPKISKPFTEAELAEQLVRIVPKTRKSGVVPNFRTGTIPGVNSGASAE